MNKQILTQYNIEFYKSTDGLKFLNSDVNWLSTYIYIYRDVETVTEFITDIELAMNGNFSQIADPDWSSWMGARWNAYLTPSGLEIWQDIADKSIIPLSDMREILMSWREFLEEK